MKIILVLSLLLMVCDNAFSKSFTCYNYEYNELKELDKDELKTEYCTTIKLNNIISKKIYNGNLDLWNLDDMGNCLRQLKRVERIYNKKYKKIPDCPEKLFEPPKEENN